MTKKTFEQKLDEKLISWDDEECLFNFTKFLERVGISTDFVQDDDGMIVGQTLTMNSGLKAIISEPQALPWPLQPVPFPDDEELVKRIVN